MSGSADLSVEVGHMYLDLMTEEMVRLEAERAALWVKPLVAAHGWQKVSYCVLLDNYTRFKDRSTGLKGADAVSMVVDEFAGLSIPVHHVAWEAACAETVRHIEEMIVEEPRQGAGSRDGTSEPPLFDRVGGWLSNGDEPRVAHTEIGSGVLQRQPARPNAARDPRYQHVIALDVQLRSKENQSREDSAVRWACPTLAAWWQLIRLGALEQLGLPPEPSSTWSAPNAPPLRARRTLTLLPARYVEVEHAVMNILRQVALPQQWVTALQETEKAPPPRAHMERIAYIFVPDHFAPRWLRRHEK